MLDSTQVLSNLNAGVAVPSSKSPRHHYRLAHGLWSVGLLVFCDAQHAHAQSAAALEQARASDRATARALAGEGYAALEKKDYVTAEERFQRADELVHAPTLVLDRARALVGLGRFGEAYLAYDSIIREKLSPSAPAVWFRAQKDAAVEIETVKPKVAWLIVQINGTSEALVEINGRALASQRFGERLPETPGEFHVVVSAPGYVTRRIDQQLRAGEEKRLEVSLVSAPKPQPEVVLVAPARTAESEHAQPDHGTGPRTLAYVSFAAAGVGLALGASTGILWLNARNDIKAACGGLDCQPQNETERARLEQDKRRYDTLGTVSVIGFGVGLVGAATGTVLLLSQPKEPESPSKRASIHAYVGPATVGVYGAFQ